MRTPIRILSLVAPTVALFAAARTSGAAPVKVYQDTIQGGISVDATGVSTPRSVAACNVAPYSGACSTTTPPAEPDTFYTAPKPLQMSIPPTATIEKAYLVLKAKYSGFNSETPEADVRFNGKLVSETAGAPVVTVKGSATVTTTGTRVFDVTTGFDLVPSKQQYTIEEAGRADTAA
ncbi:MAG TPA: hypothetical protein PLI95_30930, partial [Polyangiaceae bacterium]|nr:hypothetical protein [Polyangiaceae bacterium]